MGGFGFVGRLSFFGLVLLLVRPVPTDLVTVGAVAAICAPFALRALSGGWRSNLGARLFIRLALIGLAFVLTGMLYGNPGVLEAFVVFVAVPIVGVLIAGTALPIVCDPIFRAVSWGGVIIAIDILSAVYGGQAMVSNLLVSHSVNVNSSNGLIEVNSVNIGSLVGVVPLLVSRCYVDFRSGSRIPLLRLAAASLSLVAAIVSGRQALLIVCLASLPTAVAVYAVLQRKSRKYRADRSGLGLLSISVAAGSLIVVAPYLGISPGAAVSRLFGSFEGWGASVRLAQGEALLRSWAQHPIFGGGFGAFTRDYVRDAEAPWKYELQYHVLLNSVGLVGFVLYVVVWLAFFASVISGARPVRWLGPALVALLMMFLANSTNPYLQAPGHAWVVLLPGIIIGTLASGVVPVAVRGARIVR
jgi:hypothetical protein